jgi:hypothetical protein
MAASCQSTELAVGTPVPASISTVKLGGCAGGAGGRRRGDAGLLLAVRPGADGHVDRLGVDRVDHELAVAGGGPGEAGHHAAGGAAGGEQGEGEGQGGAGHGGLQGGALPMSNGRANPATPHEQRVLVEVAGRGRRRRTRAASWGDAAGGPGGVHWDHAPATPPRTPPRERYAHAPPRPRPRRRPG